MTRRHCTVPEILGFRKWFESRFGDICELHDKAYEQKKLTRKMADVQMRRRIVARGYLITGWAAYIAVRVFGASSWK